MAQDLKISASSSGNNYANIGSYIEVGGDSMYDPAVDPGIGVAKYAPAVDPGIGVAKYAPAVDPGIGVAKYAPAVDPGIVVAKYAPAAPAIGGGGDAISVPASADRFAIKIPSTVEKDTLRCDSKGDGYAMAIFNNGSGFYDKLKTSFENIATICNKALKNKKIDVASIKSECTNAKKKALSQKTACEQRKFDLQKQYEVTKDIFASIK